MVLSGQYIRIKMTNASDTERTFADDDITSVDLGLNFAQNAAPTSGDPEYSGQFIVESYKPALSTGAAITFDAMLKPASGTAPNWATVS